MIEDKPKTSGISLSKENFSDPKTKDHQTPKMTEDLENMMKPLQDEAMVLIKKVFIPVMPYIPSAKQLFKINLEFRIIAVLLIIWIFLTIFEFFFAIGVSEPHIISDAFFNCFKTISFCMTCCSILLAHINSSNKDYLSKRIELISALSSIIFLVIVSVHMVLQSMHILTEEHEHHVPYNFLKIFDIIKSITDIISLLILSDYILHPSIQIKLNLWKITKTWKALDEYSFDQIKKCRQSIKIWNNHYENMNALCSCLISDLVTSIMFIVDFSMIKDKYYGKIHLIISLTNFAIVYIVSMPLLSSAINILMQGKSMIYESVLNKIEREITYFDGCMGIKDKKFWMTSQNEIRGYIKIYGQSTLDKNGLKENIHKICEEVQLNCDFTIEISE